MLYKLMLRDFRKHKLQFLSIFLLAFFAVFTYAGISAEINGFQSVRDDYYNQTNMADVYIYGSIDNDTINSINDISSTKSTQRQFIIDSTGVMADDPIITLHYIENNDVSQFYLIEGDEFNIDDADGIWLDYSFAKERNLSVGDNITFKYDSIESTKTIRALGYSPDYIFAESESLTPDFYKYSFGYLSYKAFDGDISYNTVLIKTSDNSTVYEDNVAQSVNHDNYNTYVPVNDTYNHIQVQNEIEQHEMFAGVLPILFIVIALLTLLTTMNRIINNQRTEIGTLKALGFTTNRIIIHYLSYAFYITLFGSICGAILGYVLLPPIFYDSLSKFYILPLWQQAFDINTIWVIVIEILTSILITYVSARSVSLENPAITLKPKAPKVSTKGFIEKSHLWNKLNFTFKWNFRDIKRNKLRTIINILGVMSCVMLLVAAIGMHDTMDDFKTWEFGKINHYDTELTLESNITQEELDLIKEDVNATEVLVDNIEVRANNIEKKGTITSYNKTYLITPTDDYYNPVDLPEDGVSISAKMAQLLNVSVGDTVEWHLYSSDKWVTTKVDAIYSDPIYQGIIISPQYLQDIGLNYTPTKLVTNDEVTKNYTGIKSTTTTKQLMNSFEELQEEADLMTAVLILTGSILSVVILYDLGLMFYTENERDMSTLKILGMKIKKIRKLLLTPNIIYTVIGYLLGVPFGYYILKYSMDTAGESYYYPINISTTNLVITFLFTLILTTLVSRILSRKLKTIDMVESLKMGE